MKIGDILYELIYDDKVKDKINLVDGQLKDILEKFQGMFIDMTHHQWKDDSEIYGGITFGEFKRIYLLLLILVQEDSDYLRFDIPLPCKIGTTVYSIYADDCGNQPCSGSCEECKDAYWKIKPIEFSISCLPELDKSVFITESGAKNRIDLIMTLNEKYPDRNNFKWISNLFNKE